MKVLLIGLLTLGSVSSFAGFNEQCEYVSLQALRKSKTVNARISILVERIRNTNDPVLKRTIQNQLISIDTSLRNLTVDLCYEL